MPAWWRDRWFLLALLAGPAVWGLLLLIGPLVGLQRASGAPPASLLLSSVLLLPVIEELAFRGLLQGVLLERARFRRRVARVSGANLVVSLLFAAAHLWSQPPALAAAVFVPSLVFGACRERFDSVIPGMVLHGFYNAGFVALFALQT